MLLKRVYPGHQFKKLLVRAYSGCFVKASQRPGLKGGYPLLECFGGFRDSFDVPKGT